MVLPQEKERLGRRQNAIYNENRISLGAEPQSHRILVVLVRTTEEAELHVWKSQKDPTGSAACLLIHHHQHVEFLGCLHACNSLKQLSEQMHGSATQRQQSVTL